MTLALTVLVFAGAAGAALPVLRAAFRAARERARAEAGGEGQGLGDGAGRATRTNAAPSRMGGIYRFVSPDRLVLLRFGFGAGLAGAAVAGLLGHDVLSPWVLLPVAALAGAVGWRLPVLWFAARVRRRKARFDGQILGLAMSLSNGLRSGQALPQALDAVAKRSLPPMQEELGVVLREMRLGLELAEALERLHGRMPGEDLRLLVTSVKLTLQTGGSLADVLGRMVETIRARTEFQEKVRTMTAQGRFEAIAMSLAPVFVYILLRLIDPALMKPLTSTLAGWVTVGAVAVMIALGFFVINKIVTIEV